MTEATDQSGRSDLETAQRRDRTLPNHRRRRLPLRPLEGHHKMGVGQVCSPRGLDSLIWSEGETSSEEEGLSELHS